MASFVKYNIISEDLAEKAHNFGSDTLKLALSNTAPDATDTDLTSITEISAGNGYSSGGATITVTASSQAAGTYKIVANDVVFTASGGTIGPFRYVIWINSTANRVIGYWDYASAITLQDGETFTVDFSPTNGVLQIA